MIAGPMALSQRRIREVEFTLEGLFLMGIRYKGDKGQ